MDHIRERAEQEAGAVRRRLPDKIGQAAED
jgi:hypothetical protein